MERNDKPVIRCPRCERENPPGGVFCIFCGAPLVGIASEEEEQPQEARPEGQAPSLEGGLREIRRVLTQLTDRMAALERLQGGRVPQTPQAASPPAEPVSVAAGAPGTEAVAPTRLSTIAVVREEQAWV